MKKNPAPKKNMKRNGPVINLGRFFLPSVLAAALAFLSSCSEQTSAQNPTNSKQTGKTIILQNQMNPDFYEYILEKTKNSPSPPMVGNGVSVTSVWGVAIPHHQLAADVMAQTLYQLKDNDYENIYMLSPDHYDRGRTQIAFTEAPLKTAMGTTKISENDIETLKKMDKTSDGKGFMAFEHGIGTPIPFVMALWPQAKVTPILIRSDARKEDLTELIGFLEQKSRQSKTLIVESSDFSHYLTPEEARRKDLQTIETLKQEDPEKILGLNQPGNCDSINILYIMKSLQASRKADLEFYLNKNSQDYTKETVTSSTSYITFFIGE